MAPSSLSAASPPSSSVSVVTKTTSHFPLNGYCYSRNPRRASFHLSRPVLRFLSKPSQNRKCVVKAQSNKVAGDGSSSASAPSPAEGNDSNSLEEPSSSSALATEESISEFIARVKTLVKLVDSRDVAELQLKELDCELVIRKKEALPQSQSPNPVVMMPPPTQPSFMPPAHSPVPVAPPASSAPSSSASSPSPSPPPSTKSSLPTIQCPMAGTFYRSSAPGEPPFIKVGDKVQKGQVLCIIEAMKLMNEIEADQSGTIVDILAEDGKAVSIDMPLFVIQP